MIGKIAASHHWDVADLVKGLPATHGSLAGMPTDWMLRPVLLACLLRCADATRLDQSRTPDFLFGLLKAHGALVRPPTVEHRKVAFPALVVRPRAKAFVDGNRTGV